MISSRFFLLNLALVCSLSHSSTAFRTGSHSARTSPKRSWPGRKRHVATAPSEKSLSPEGSKRFATLAFPPDDVAMNDGSEVTEGDRKSLLQRVKKYFTFKDDGMTSKQRLAKMGLDVILSYGFVQNVSHTITISLAWFLFSAQTGLSPLAPGQWKPFLAINAGFMVFQNIIRPVHVALAVVVSPYFDKIVDGFQNRFNFSRKASVIITALLANLVGTLALMGTGISIAASLAGVPVFP